MIRCPNFRSDKARDDFNAVLARLGGVAMSADDISPRQPYLARLNEKQTQAYHVAHYLWNAHKTPAEIGAFLDALDQVRDALEAEPAPTPAKTLAPAQKAENETGRPPSVPGDVASTEAAPLSNLPAINLARDLLERLRAGKPISTKIMQQMAAEIYGAKLSEGHFDRKDMQDALELAVNMRIAEDAALRTDKGEWREPMAKLDELLSKLPTQRVRSEEQESFQQFSTPPTYSAAAAYAANLRDGDVVLEPSAGTGSLVAATSKPGVKIIANELSERRTALLRALIGDRIFHENAEQLNNTLPDSVKPSIVVMNPPFSQTAGRMGDKKVPMTGAIHVEQGLKRLEPGGRLVAIVGRGMTMGAPVYRAWWSKIGKEYTVRANIGVDGKVFEKYGTTFGTRLLVIDKVKPTGEAPVLADAQTVDDLMRALEPIRNARTAAEQHGAQSAGAELAEASQDAGGAPLSEPAAAGGVGPGERGIGGLAGEGATSTAGSGEPDVRVEAGEHAGVAAVEPGSGRPSGATGQSPEVAGGRGQPEGRGGARPQRNLGPAGGDDAAATARSERVELEHAEPGSQGAAEISDSLYDQYRPQRVKVPGAKPHPSKLVESAAMASVPPPAPTYKPSLPRAVIEKGLLSDAQIEPVIYAGEAHAKMLPAAEGEPARRKGFFIGDGTGVGKGREVAGIILDNWNQGRTKAVWVSEKRKLLTDAKRDWKGLQQNPDHLFDVGKVKTGEPIDAKKGIAFVTYDTLKGGMSDQAALSRGGFVRKQSVSVNGQPGLVQSVGKVARGKPAQITVKLENGTTVTVPAKEVKAEEKAAVKSRIDQLADWFGKDFDGVIAFDEAHNMGNATDTKGDRGQKDAAMKAIAGMDLQKRLPNARIVYVSATGATEVSNLAYADRLGLWGRGTPFASRAAFVSQVTEGGIAAMELIARDMKQLGLYTARNLSYDGVEYDRVEHKLDANQREIYDTLAQAWQVVLRDINAALKLTGGNFDSRAKSAAMSAFWGGHQRFFNQIITSMQMPSVVKAVEQDLAAGRQVVLQLTNTNEASQERAAAKAQTAEDIEDLDITPRDQIIQLVENSFPTQEYETYVDDDGKERSRPVVDSNGNAVQNKEAVAMRERLIDQLASVRVPQGPLDLVLDHFGVDTVAEVTGRGRRFVLKPDEKTGQKRRVEESRPGSANQAETDAFQEGKKKVLIFSEAGGTGASYHADNTAASKDARRSHYLVQGGWRADKAVQGFGRTHRSNQASAPIFRLVTTDLQGQKRFISSIARRLGQLGALTKGERKAGDQGIFSARDNLESTEARTALTQFFRDIYNNAVPGIDINDFEEQTGLKLRNKDEEGRSMGMLEDLPPITQFLNRLLSLKFDLQNTTFNSFSERLDAVIEARREAGLLDVGLETVKADKIAKETEQTVHTVEGSGAQTKYVKLKLSDKFKATDFDTVASNEWRKVTAWLESPNGKVYAAAEAPSLTDASTGRIIDSYRLVSPVSDSRTINKENVEKPDTKWKKIEKSEASALWRKEIAAAPEYVTRDMHLITGAILPIWDRLKGNPRVVRLATEAGERLIGRVVPNDAIAATLKALGAEAKAQSYTAADVFLKVRAGGRATLANGWTLSRRLVAGEHRIELTGPSAFSEAQEVKKDGVFTERIDYKTRFFVPTDAEAGSRVIERLTQYRPVTDLVERGAAPHDMAAGDEPMFSVKGDDRVKGESDALAEAVARRLLPALRAELDRMGLSDIPLNLPGTLTARIGAKKYELNGYYFRQAITIALNAEDIGRTLHHEALHALHDLGVFKDTEWQILTRQSDRAWRKQFRIEEGYAHLADELRTEEGIAHAYAAWAKGEMKVDGRIARLFKRIRDFFEALRNALRGLGFKSAEDVFRNIKEGEIGNRARAGAGDEPMFEMRRDNAPAEARATPNLNRRIRDRIEAALDSKFGRKFIEGTQDLSHPVKLLQDELEMRREGAFEDPEDFYTRKRLYPGRVGAWTDTFNKKHLDPIVRLLKANNIPLADAGDFLYALHAAERNEAMDRINPGLGGEGSGMSNEEAAKIIAEVKRGEHAAAFDELREKVGKIRDLILNVMEKSGLEKPEVIAEWKKRYEDYVPLRGWEVEPDDAPPEFRGPGAGFNVRGKEVKQALGRRSKADNPIVNLFDQAYRTFDRAERNRYLQSLYRAIDDLGDEASDVATLDRGKPQRTIDKRTGLVKTVENSGQYMNPKAVYLKFDGNPHFMVFADQELAEAVKRMSADSVGIFHAYLKLQNKMKALWTHYSPDFLFRHFMFRYPIEGALNSFEQKEGGEHKVNQYIRDAFPFVGRASKAIFASNKGIVHDDPAIREMQEVWDKVRRGGGAMMFRNMRDIDLTREHLQTALKDLSDRPLANARAKWRHGIEALDTITNALDNSLRLAAAYSAIKQGKTVQQAALIAREATVDFQLKGRWNNLMGIFFPFSNVAIQTTARMTKAVYRSRIMRRVFGSTLLAGFLVSAFNYLVAGDDKDSIPFFDKIPEWDRRLNFIILNPFDTDDKGPQPIKIPMPYNWAFPLVLGYAFGGMMFGKEGPKKLMTMLARSAMETFTPLGSEQNLAGIATPEAFRPLVHIYTNEDWAGRPIHVDPDFQKRPNAYSPRKTTGAGWSAIAKGVNTATGGSPGKSGVLDLYPEDYREMIDQFAGTQIRLGQNIWDTGESVAEGKWPQATKIPLERVIRGTDYDAADRARGDEARDRQKHPWKH
ncbi:MAG: strawberry notch-like NTP hydrolase domain-containing protein [Xanthobacteraceae bacterium]|jgi:predicted RNA methylase